MEIEKLIDLAKHYQILPLKQEFIPQVIDLAINSFMRRSKFYQKLALDPEIYKLEIQSIIQNPKNQFLSYVITLKKDPKTPIAAKIVLDLAYQSKHLQLVPDERLQFLQNMDFLIFQEEMDENMSPGQICSNYLSVVDQDMNFSKDQIEDIKYLMNVYFVKQMYEKGYQKDVSMDLACQGLEDLCISGKRFYDLQGTIIQGENVFEEYTNGVWVYTTYFDELSVEQILGKQYVKKYKKQLEQQRKNYQYMNRLQMSKL